MRYPLTQYNSIFLKYGIDHPDFIALAEEAWKESHRHWRNFQNHLSPLLEMIDDSRENLGEDLYGALVITAVFHDIVFDPRSEQEGYMRSAMVMKHLCKNKQAPYYDEVIETIEALGRRDFAINPVAMKFHACDKSILQKPLDFREMLEYEKYIFKEYQNMDFRDYKVWRIRRLENWNRSFPQYKSLIGQLVEYINYLKPKIGVYVGSFDPFHKGHYNVLKQAERLFDKVIIAVGINPAKQDQGDVQRRKDEIKSFLPFHQIEFFEGFFTEFLESLDYPTTVIRGVRNTTDLNEEIGLQQTFKDLFPDVTMVYFFSDVEYQHISSTRVRNFRAIQPGSENIYLLNKFTAIDEKLGIM